MFSQLCKARLWPRPRKKSGQLERLKVQRNAKNEDYIAHHNYQQNEELNKSLYQITGYLSRDEERNLTNGYGFCQETNNPAYGLMPASQTKQNMHRITGKQNLKEATEESPNALTSDKNASCNFQPIHQDKVRTVDQKPEVKCDTLIVSNKCHFTNIRSQPLVSDGAPRNNRVRKRCQKRRVAELQSSRQNKALEEVVNMFDRHFSEALSLQHKNNNSSEDSDGKSAVSFTPLHQSTLKHRTIPCSKRIDNTVANKNTAGDTFPKCRRTTVLNMDVEKLLQVSTRENPTNISMVVMQCSRLKSHNRNEPPFQETSLAMGTLVNALFAEDDWLYVQTPHGREGFVHRSCCVSMGRLHKNMEITGRDNCKSKRQNQLNGTEDFKLSSRVTNENSKNVLYNVLADVNPKGFRNDYKKDRNVVSTWDKSVLAVIRDYSSETENMLTVKKGDLVHITEITGSSDDKDWLWVQTSTGKSGYIPKAIAKPVAVF